MTSKDSPVAINLRTHSAWQAINVESKPKIRLGSSFKVRALHFDKIKQQHTFFPKGQHTHIVNLARINTFVHNSLHNIISRIVTHLTAIYGRQSTAKYSSLPAIYGYSSHNSNSPPVR